MKKRTGTFILCMAVALGTGACANTQQAGNTQVEQLALDSQDSQTQEESSQQPETQTPKPEADTQKETQKETQNEEPKEPETQIETEKTEGEQTENQIYKDFVSCVEEIYEVQAGAAGSSLRAEGAAEKLISFAFTYGVEARVTVFQHLTEQWLESLASDSGFSKDDFVACFLLVTETAYEQNSGVETDVAFAKVVSGIKEGLGVE